jgi:hypothetical protein
MAKKEIHSLLNRVLAQDVVSLHGGNGHTLYGPYNAFKKKIAKKHRIMHKTLFQQVFSSIINITAEQIVEQEGGVCLKGIGYWCVARSSVKRIYTSKISKIQFYNLKNGMRPSKILFFPYFRAESRSASMRFYSMDQMPNESLAEAVGKKLKEGKKYKIYPHTLKRLKLL